MPTRYAKKSEESPATAFHPHSLKTDAQQPVRVKPCSFEETTRIQESHGQYSVYIPVTIARDRF